MKAVVCTVFENHYHYGVAALINSLYVQGYRGDVFAGYKGDMPHWASSSVENQKWNKDGVRTFTPVNGIDVHFVKLNTSYHLTNYKPDFMLTVVSSFADKGVAICYLDPDIVLTAPWSFMQEWFATGIALCEDVNSPLYENHPRRVEWRKFFGKSGIELRYKTDVYVNGGFVAVDSSNMRFLGLWKRIQETMAARIGGLERSSLVGVPLEDVHQGPFAPFSKTDQDALNATIEAFDGPVSIMGAEAMGFRNGMLIMPHALGKPKPWEWNFFKQTILGNPPRITEKNYWIYANGIIKLYPNSSIRMKRAALKVSSFLGRFYRRNGN